jgi:glycosyltransferase involved in cell wall biosynthesis
MSKRRYEMSQLIRVLHVLGHLDANGAESRTMDIYRAVDKKKVQFDFAVHTDERCDYHDEVEEMEGKVYHFPRFRGKNYNEYNKAWDSFFKEHPEYQIIHGHLTNPGYIYLNAAKKNGVPVRIAHTRNSQKENFIKKMTGKLSRFPATDLFAVSGIAGVNEFGHKRMRNGDVKIIPNAIHAEKYIYNYEKRQEKRKELGIEGKFAVFNISRFHPQKNHKFLVEAFKYIAAKENAVLVLVGDGPLRDEIEQQIKELHLENNVIFTGIRNDIPELLQAMDVLLFPSLFEGMPGVVLEAQAAGLPAVISDSITEEVKITDLVQSLPLKDGSEAFAEKTLQFIGYPRRNTYNEIVQAGFDTKSVAAWYESFYKTKLNL